MSTGRWVLLVAAVCLGLLLGMALFPTLANQAAAASAVQASGQATAERFQIVPAEAMVYALGAGTGASSGEMVHKVFLLDSFTGRVWVWDDVVSKRDPSATVITEGWRLVHVDEIEERMPLHTVTRK